MKITEHTIAILKNFSLIHSEMEFVKGKKQRTRSVGAGSIFAEASFDEDVPDDFCIYNLTQFLSAISLVQNDPELELLDGGEVVRISSGDGSVHIDYRTVDSDMIDVPSRATPRELNYEIEFELKEEDLNRIIKAASTMSLKVISVESDGESNMALVAVDPKNPSSNRYSMEIDSTSSVECVINFAVENLKLISDSYKVQVSKDSMVAKFTGNYATYWIGAQSDSTFG